MGGKTLRKKKPSKSRRVFTKKNYQSGDGMLTNVWGPSLWHYLHTMSFNYPVNPTNHQKKCYKQFILNLQHTLPCGQCRKNLVNNLKTYPLSDSCLENRDKFSRFVYGLHETINTMLGKKSGLTYCQVRERYEHFRARCLEPNARKKFNFKEYAAKTKKKGHAKEKGCTEPMYGRRSKCLIKIVPLDHPSKTLHIDKKCLKRRTQKMKK